jgi:hypothetical protein
VEGDESDSGERGAELGLGLSTAVGASSDWIRCSDSTKSSTRESRASQLTGVESIADWLFGLFSVCLFRPRRRKEA